MADGGKDWQKTVTPEIKATLINNLIQILSNSRVLDDKESIINTANLIEQSIFNRAQSRSEYYYCVAENIYILSEEQCDLTEKLNSLSLNSANTVPLQDLKTFSTTDVENCQVFRQQLISLLHAHICNYKQQNAADCTFPNCIIMKDVLNHLQTCNLERNCSVKFCSSSKQVINHWKNCIFTRCLVCNLKME